MTRIQRKGIFLSTILILEDQTEIGETWQTVLSENGHKVLYTTNYDEFEAAFKSGRTIDLIIVDLAIGDNENGPKFDGLSALSDNFLRATLRGKKVPTIIVSGHISQIDDDPLRQRVMTFGPDRILPKPFPINDLINAVDELLNSQ